MQTIYLGIDPGKTGALAIIHPVNGVKVYDFEGGIGLHALRQTSFEFLHCNLLALLEAASTRPGEGRVSALNYGTNFGRWWGRLEALSIPFEFVTPRVWQEVMFKGQPKVYKMVKGKKKLDTKTMSLTVARQLFPAVDHYFLRKKDHGRSDALLIAEYNRRTKGYFTRKGVQDDNASDLR